MTASEDLRHVLFDGKPEVLGHVCPKHKALVDSLRCDDEQGPDGQCAHVQYRACDCVLGRGCDMCDIWGDAA